MTRTEPMSRQERLHDALFVELNPDILLIEDESGQHHVPSGAESHYKIVAVSTHFNTLNRVARHRLVNSLVSQEFSKGLHALSLHLFTPEEWLTRTTDVQDSPKCRDGKRHG